MLRSSRLSVLILPIIACFVVPGSASGFVPPKPVIVRMDDAFLRGNPLSYWAGMPNAAAVETTIRHQIFFSDMEGDNSNWSVVNYRQGQPVAWHVVTGTHACTGNSWWCGQTGLPHGDGYDNDWVQSLRTVVPIDLTGTSKNTLTFKYMVQTEFGYDYLWVLMRGNGAAHYDTLASFTGDFGTSCANASVSVPDSFTTVTQPVELRFLFGSDESVSAGDSTGPYTGATLDDIKITSKGNVTSFFDDMESGTSQWAAESPNPGSLWHIENSPSTSVPATCFFLSTNVWVPFVGSGFGPVPDFGDAMLVSPPMDLNGVFSPNTPAHTVRLQFDDWINLPPENYLFWELFISGSDDQVTWTPWRDPYGQKYSNPGASAQCTDTQQDYRDFDPYDTATSGIPFGTRYLRVGFRIRDEKADMPDDGPLRLGYDTEGIYFDNVGLYYIYTISGVEPVASVPAGTRASIRNVYPNPFNPHTTIEFSVPTAGPVAVRVFDIHGKEVATLVDTPMSPGIYRARWNGRDARGGEVASGMYFASVQSGGTRDTARLLLLK